MIAPAVSDQGEREVIGATVTDGEMESAWREFLEHLVQRGLRGVMLVISDAHLGLKGAVRKVLVGAAWQRCTVHFLRNVLSRVPRNAQGVVGGAIKSIFKQPTLKEAREAVGKALATLQKRFPGVASLLREGEEDVLAFMAFPEKHWRQIHSTNPLERLNREIRRRTDVVGIFPTVHSVLRLTVMLLAEQQDEWIVGRRYFSLESMALLKTQAEKTLEAA
jgi:transposase-like protein